MSSTGTKDPAHSKLNIINVDGDNKPSSDDPNDLDYTSSEGSTDTESDEGPKKPEIKKPRVDSRLQSRLATLLPQMEKANAELDSEIQAKALQVDDVSDDEENYIEMNLGLGVLSEIKEESNVLVENSSDSDEDAIETLETNMPQFENRASNLKPKRKIEELD